MRRLAGQAARQGGRLAHALVQIVLAVALTSMALVAALTWRLAQGPLELPWLIPRIEQAAADAGMRLRLGGAALAWEGFSAGVDRPIDIQVRGAVMTDAAGTRIAAVPDAAISLSTRRLLLGQIVPRAIEVDGARLHVTRTASGDVTFDLGDLLDSPAPAADAASTTPPADAASAAPGGVPGGVVREFLRAPAGDRTRGAASHWSQLRHVRIRGGAVDVTDRQLGTTWALHGVGIDLERLPAGGVAGRADGSLRLGQQIAHLSLTADLDQATGVTSLTAGLAQIVPAGLARDVPAAASLLPFDLPVAFSATAQLGPDLLPAAFTAHADLGAGVLRLGRQGAIVLDGALDAKGTPSQATLDLTHLEIAARPGGPRTTLRAEAEAARAPDGGIAASGTLDLDEVAFADLPALWPEGVGGPGTRPWITGNIPAGIARNGHLAFALTAPADLSDATVTRLRGGIDGADLTVHWLRPVPPVVGAAAHLSLDGIKALTIDVTNGAQANPAAPGAPPAAGGLRIQGGRVVITGLDAKDQFADIQADLAGPLPDLLTLLRNPRVRLLDRSPLPLKDASGQIAGGVTVTQLPLRDDVTMDDVTIRTSAKLSDVRLPDIAAGRDLDHGDITLDASADGLHAAGAATLAGIPATLQIDLDFRAGPKTQVLQKIAVSATADARQLAALGLDAPGVLGGSVAIDAAVAIRRGGDGDARITADLARASLTLAALNFAKPAGRAAALSATVRLDGQRVAAIAPLRIDGEGLHLDASASFAGGQPDVLTIRRAALGAGTDLHGEVRVPHGAGEPWRVTLAGPSLDASSQLSRTPTPESPPKPAQPPPEPPSGPPYIADLTFDRVLLGKGRAVAGVVAHAESDGRILRSASLSGRTLLTGGGGTGGGAPFTLAIAPAGSGRTLHAGTADAGGLLLALDIDDKIQGGQLTITGSYDDAKPGHPLLGTARIDDFRVHGAPFLAKLLEGMTLYGLVELAQGPGLGFTRLVAPFRLTDNVLELFDARAFNASLGMTAKGRIDLSRHAADIAGTIVPAYFFNSLLGDIPLVGKLFSPERGGGLFAATYSVRGPLDDPAVSVNPLAVLTPGFLRGVFNLFDTQPTDAPPPTDRPHTR